MRRVFLTALALAAAAPATAQTLAPGNGFTSVHTLAIAATPDKVWATLVRPSAWWDPAHSYSGDASRIDLELRAGGCWCEALPDGGSVEHMRVLLVQPGRTLRLSGGLGPLQAMPVTAVMTFALKPAGAGSDLTITYKVAGADALETLAKPVDAVLAGQWSRLKAAAER